MPFSLLDYSLQFVNNKCCEHSRWQKGLLLPSVEHFGLPRKKIFAVSNPDTRFLLDFVLDPNTTDGLLIASQDFWSTEFYNRTGDLGFVSGAFCLPGPTCCDAAPFHIKSHLLGAEFFFIGSSDFTQRSALFSLQCIFVRRFSS